MIHLYEKLLALIIAVIVSLLLPCRSFSGEPGTDFMIDLWKYRTGEADTGLLTGRPSQISPEAAPLITANVTGTVACMQDLPLHANDIIEVQLLDFSSRSSAAVIAYQQITSAREMPIPFKLTYDPARINPAHHYTVQARIMRNGEPAYSNTAPAFVLTNGYANNVRVLVADAGGERAALADYDSRVSPSPADTRVYIGTYTRSFSNAGVTVEETLRILSDHTMKIYAQCGKNAMNQDGVWSLEKRLLAITVTSKNGEPVNPERIVLELKGASLVAIEYNAAAHGRNYSFTRKAERQ